MKKQYLRALTACDVVSADTAEAVGKAAEEKDFEFLDVFTPPGSGGRSAVMRGSNGRTFLAVRGSGSEDSAELARNVQDDAYAVPLALPDHYTRSQKARGHAGIVRHADGFIDWMAEYADQIDVVTGFSLGCGASLLLAMALSRAGCKTTWIGFAGPRVLNKAGCGVFKRAVPAAHRIVLPGDIVPTVPPPPVFRHVHGLVRLGRDFPDFKPEHDRKEYRKAIKEL